MATSESFCEVLVVGGGPVGLMMAGELARHGVGCRLIERLPKAAPYCKALGITPRTMEMWDDLGIANQAIAAGLPLRGMINIANGDMNLSEESGVALADGAYGFLTLAQYDAERILTEHFTSLGGKIERQVELVAFAENKDGVQATLQHADGRQETVRCNWLIGCDGGRSTVRRTLKLPFEGDHYEQVFLLADVELDWSLARGYAYKLARLENDQMQGAAACIPVPGNPRRYRFSTTAPPEMIPPEVTGAGQPMHGIMEIGPRLEQVQELLTWFFPTGVRASNMRWSSYYRISHRIVSSYRVGRVFLAGDAAHLHPPLGGQGMNAGMQDAYNLAWKLASVVQGNSPAELLDSYDAECRKIGKQTVDRTTARMSRVLEGHVDEQEPIRDDSQLFLNYRDSGWVANDLDIMPEHAAGPLAGDRRRMSSACAASACGSMLGCSIFCAARNTRCCCTQIIPASRPIVPTSPPSPRHYANSSAAALKPTSSYTPTAASRCWKSCPSSSTTATNLCACTPPRTRAAI